MRSDELLELAADLRMVVELSDGEELTKVVNGGALMRRDWEYVRSVPPTELNRLNSSGYGMMHGSVDRADLWRLRELIRAGADVDLR
jgi:hypothetical protein